MGWKRVSFALGAIASLGVASVVLNRHLHPNWERPLVSDPSVSSARMSIQRFLEGSTEMFTDETGQTFCSVVVDAEPPPGTGDLPFSFVCHEWGLVRGRLVSGGEWGDMAVAQLDARSGGYHVSRFATVTGNVDGDWLDAFARYPSGLRAAIEHGSVSGGPSLGTDDDQLARASAYFGCPAGAIEDQRILDGFDPPGPATWSGPTAVYDCHR
jgi:hypothetical protein